MNPTCVAFIHDFIQFFGAILGGAIAALLGSWCNSRSIAQRAKNDALSLIYSIKDAFEPVRFNKDSEAIYQSSLKQLREYIYTLMPMHGVANRERIKKAWNNYYSLRDKQWNKDDIAQAFMTSTDAQNLVISEAKTEILTALQLLENSID